MQRTILRTIAVMSVMCLCYLIPPQVLANASDYGPERDPIISDESENISLTCPPPITVDCDEDGIYMSYAEFEAAGGSVNLPDGCAVDSFTFVVDIQSSQNGCTFVYMRQYFITETCGNTFTCNQIVMQTDDDDPVIVGTPSDTTFSVTASPCTVAFMVPELSATDGCSEATVTNNAPSDFSIGATVVVYTAMDQCGNESQDSFTVNVINNSPIIVTCPPGIMDTTVCDSDGIAAYVDFDAFVAAGGSATRDCDSAGTTFVLESFFDVQLGGSCPKTVNRTYVISDGNGNVDSCTQLLTIIDNDGPTFTVPADMMDVDCAVAQDTSITGAPTDIMDNCDSMFVVTYEDMVTAGSCMGEDTILRTWTVADQCNNETQEVQTIITVDNTPPTAICKDTVYVYLDTLGFTPIVADSLDNGSSDACSDVTFSAMPTFAACNEVNIPKTVMLFVEDDCGNKDTCELIVIALDTMDVVLTAPANDTVQCITDVDPVFPDTTGFEVINNCPSGSSFAMIQADTNGVCPIIVTRIYEYSDLSGNSDTALHTIFVIDTIPPVIDSCPSDITISETDICDTLLVFGLPDVTDNCGDVVITNNYTNDTSSMATFSGGTTIILFTATDGCGNQDTCSMMVTVDAAPKITCPPMGIIDSEEDLPDYPDLEAFLMAGGMINAFCAFDTSTFMYTNSFVIDSCTAMITETISISDTQGNPLVETKMSTATDTINPEITNCNDQFVPLNPISCEIDTNFSLPIATDNFGVDTTYYTLSAFEEDTALVVFFAVDFCGNIDSCDFEIIIYDPTSPDLDIDDITIMCDSTGAAPVYATLDEFLAAPGASIIECRIDTSSFGLDTTYVNMNGDSVRVYSIDDLEGQTGTVMQTIFVMDSTEPEFTMCTDDISVNAEIDTCGAFVMVPQPVYMDNCDTIILTNDYNGTADASDFYIVGSTTVIWTIEDGNGLTDTCSFVVTVTDATPPDVECPGDTTIMCTIDNYPPFTTIPDFIAGGGQASDNCDLIGISSTTMASTPNNYIRTYIVVDANGLQDTCTQAIAVIDTVPPELMCDAIALIVVNADTLSCDKFVNISTPTATDNCDMDVDVTNSLTGASNPSGVFSDTTVIFWYAEDDFGNMDTCTSTIIVVDATGPKVTDPDTEQIMCMDMLADVDTLYTIQDIVDAGGTASDNCGIDSINFVSDTFISVDTVKRVYAIIDSTGNTSTLTQLIVIDDTTPPMFDAGMCTADITMNAETDTCGANIMVPLPIYMDNCDTVTLTNDYNGTADASDFYVVGSTTVIWTIEDGNGLTDTCSFVVTVTDATPPEVECPADTMIACTIDNYPPFTTIPDFIAGGGQASDNCGLDSISSETNLTMPNIYTRTYTVYDVNGLQDTCTQTIEIIDTMPPVFMSCDSLFFSTSTTSCDVFINIGPPAITDNCDTSVMITNSYNGQDSISGIFSGTTSVTWYAEDDFGNVDSCVFDIIVFDATVPAVSDPDTSMIMCESMLADVDTFMTVQDIIDAGGSATDNCGIDSINLVQTTITNGLVKRTYFIIDSSGNISTINHFIEIEDTTPPTFEAPDDVTVQCDDNVDDLSITGTVDSSMLADNCMDIDTLIYTDIVDSGTCPFIDEITRIWILSDNSGNETRDTQLISTIDTIAPVFDSLPGNLSDIDCDGVFPAQEVITATDNCTGATVFMDTIPFMEDICAGYEVTYRWISVDSCNNQDTITRSFEVLPDTTPPSLVNANDTIVGAESDICGIRVDNVLKPIFEEDCSMIDTLISNYTDTIYPVGTTYVLWTAQNECGLEDTVTQEIIVIDSIPPVVMCKNATAGITSDPQNFVYATSFVASATDNCDIDSILVIRMTDVCGLGDITTFKDSIPICCGDVGTIIDVMIKVVDNSGLVNFCNATLEVQDNIHPMIEEALPDITISCSFVFDTLDMDVFGTFTSDPDAREEIRIEDVFYESQDSIAGLDGLVSDECTVTITDTTIVNLDDCNIGTISRIFTFTDLGGNITTSEQIIEIQDVSPFNENGTDIDWPDDFIWDQCGVPAPDTSISGAPVFSNLDKCAQVSASYKDLLFNFPTTSCPKVRRKWQVIDWCQYDEDQTPNPGLWTYNQYIIVENNVPPTIISGCTDTLICAPNNECSAIVSLEIEAEDDCGADSQYLRYAYTINVHSDSNTGNDISGDESSFSLELENGIHEVTWVVEDRCGNETTCSYTLSVNECKDPTAVCLSGLVIVLDEEGEAELWASDVNQSSNDNCTDEDDLIFSFSSDVEFFGMEFDCEDVGTSQYIEMWVTDLEGNQSFCSTYVDVQDNNGSCNDITGNDDPTVLQGKIATESNLAIPEAMVSIFGAEMDEDFMTDNDGAYTFGGINVENDYQIKVDRDKDDMEGVSTLDLVLIQRHILGLDLLESPYKLIAADINNSESISAADLLELRKMILGIVEKFPNNESWRFVSMNGAMDDMNDPWPFSEDLIVGNAPLQEVDADFIGVKIGDVNNTVDNVWDEKSIENRSAPSFGIVTKDQKVQRDDEVFVDFLSSTNVHLEAMQMTIEWDKASMNFVDIIPIGLQIEESFINKTRVEEGIITLAWTSVDSKSIQKGMPLFQVIFEGNKSFDLSDHLSISSKVTEAIAYDQHDLKHDIELRFIEGTSQGMMMFQNKPNPFVSETEVEFTLPEDMEVTFKVFNGAGSLIYKNTQTYTEGINAFKLGEELREHRGLLFLKMETAEFSDIKRMIRIN